MSDDVLLFITFVGIVVGVVVGFVLGFMLGKVM